MTNKFSMTRDINGYNGFGLKPSDTNISATLTVSTDTTFTVPGNTQIGGVNYQTKASWLAIFSIDPGDSVWVSINAVASAPAGSTFASTTSFLNPAAIEVQQGDVIHCFTTQTGVDVSVRFYSLA
jgi:hypothetical protein